MGGPGGIIGPFIQITSYILLSYLVLS